MKKTITKLVYDYKDVTSVREGYTINAYELRRILRLITNTKGGIL